MSVHAAEKAIRAIHDRTHWCFDADEQSEVFERGVIWPCPTLAALDAARVTPRVESADGPCTWCEDGTDPAQWHTACWDEAHCYWADEKDNA